MLETRYNLTSRGLKKTGAVKWGIAISEVRQLIENISRNPREVTLKEKIYHQPAADPEKVLPGRDSHI
jgi:hypothetical protein